MSYLILCYGTFIHQQLLEKGPAHDEANMVYTC